MPQPTDPATVAAEQIDGEYYVRFFDPYRKKSYGYKAREAWLAKIIRAAYADQTAELERYESELAAAAAIIQGCLPIGEVKAVGFLEVAEGVKRMAAELERYRKERDDADEAEMILQELLDDEAAEAGGEG